MRTRATGEALTTQKSPPTEARQVSFRSPANSAGVGGACGRGDPAAAVGVRDKRAVCSLATDSGIPLLDASVGRLSTSIQGTVVTPTKATKAIRGLN